MHDQVAMNDVKLAQIKRWEITVNSTLHYSNATPNMTRRHFSLLSWLVTSRTLDGRVLILLCWQSDWVARRRWPITDDQLELIRAGWSWYRWKRVYQLVARSLHDSPVATPPFASTPPLPNCIHEFNWILRAFSVLLRGVCIQRTRPEEGEWGN